jgi:hypothetical protein
VVSGSGNQYTCDCTAITNAAKESVVVGQYCNTTISGKPVSVSGGNCPGCASMFICTSYTGDDPQAYMQSVKEEMAASFCGCTDPPNRLLRQFGGVQYMEMGASELCMEFTIYSGSPNTTAQDIVRTLETDPPPGFTVQTNRINDMELCTDAEKGCNLDDSDGDGDGGSLLYIVIGVASFVIVFLVGIAWYVIHKQVRRQWSTRTGDMVAGDALTIRSTWLQGENENVSTFKSRADATGLQNSASSRDDVITPPFDQEGKTSAVSSNDLVEINIPPRGRGSYITSMGRRARASHNPSTFLPPMVTSSTGRADRTGLHNNDNVVVYHDDHLGPTPAIEWTSDENQEKVGAAAVASSASVAASADSHNSSPALPGLAELDNLSFSSSSSEN